MTPGIVVAHANKMHMLILELIVQQEEAEWLGGLLFGSLLDEDMLCVQPVLIKKVEKTEN